MVSNMIYPEMQFFVLLNRKIDSFFMLSPVTKSRYSQREIISPNP
jgi:hypothetical protein